MAGVAPGKGWKRTDPFVSRLQHQEQHSEGRSSSTNEPHLIFIYEDKQILEDAASLISYYVKRQPTIQKEDQATIRQIVHHFIPELFFSPPPEHSISEESTDEDREHHQAQVLDTAELRKKLAPVLPSSPLDTKAMFCDVTAAEPHNTLDDVYSLFFVNNNWYFFLRLHQTLCSRLLKIYRQAQKQLLEYRSEKEREKLLCDGRKEKTNDPAMELRLKQPSKTLLQSETHFAVNIGVVLCKTIFISVPRTSMLACKQYSCSNVWLFKHADS